MRCVLGIQPNTLRQVTIAPPHRFLSKVIGSSAEGDQVTLKGERWTDTFDEDRLAGWIVFYERMHETCGQPGYRECAEVFKSMPACNACKATMRCLAGVLTPAGGRIVR